MKQKLKTLFTISCLLATSVVTIATSKGKSSQDQNPNLELPIETLTRKDYYVASNCPMAIRQERVTVSGGVVEYPSNRGFTDFGLPNWYVNLALTHQLEAQVNGRLRSCSRSEYVDRGVPLILYTCSENGFFLCHVSFELVQ